MVIASRKLERLEAAAEELKKSIPTQSPASVTAVPCNIRNEDEVETATHQNMQIQIPGSTFLFTCLFLLSLVGKVSGVGCTEAAWKDRLSC